MLRHRSFHRVAAAACAVLLVPALASCGDGSDDEASDDTSASSSPDAEESDAAPATGEVEGISFEGEVGEALTATWSAAIEKPESTTVTTVVTGDGEEVADGDTVSTYLWVGNGTSQEAVFSDYDNGAPEAIPFDDALEEPFRSLLEGQTYGSRVVAVTDAETVLGGAVEGNQLGLTADDAVVVVADIVEKQEESPTPTDDGVQDADPSTQPTVVEEGGKPTGLDFTGIDEPALDAPVQRVVLTEGDGAEVKESDTLKVDYLGSVYDADAPFDESYSRGEPLESPLSGLIQGWSIGLTGVKVGSRVLLQIPPAFGYGAQGSGSGIPGNATLWFVIDVLEVQ